jgi:hypothetical protein
MQANRFSVGLLQFLAQQGWQPVAAKQFAHLGVGACLGQEVVLFFPKHVSVSWLMLLLNRKRLLFRIQEQYSSLWIDASIIT